MNVVLRIKFSSTVMQSKRKLCKCHTRYKYTYICDKKCKNEQSIPGIKHPKNILGLHQISCFRKLLELSEFAIIQIV